MPRRIVLDVDPGIDDALAILLALASPEINLSAITVTGGNCPLEYGVRNALNVLALGAFPGPEVYAGAATPLHRPPLTAPETHGDSGLGYAHLPDSPITPSHEHAVDKIIGEIMCHPGETTLVAVAPLTNIALALRKEPRIAQMIEQIIIMGGAFQVEGNTTPFAEFNFYVDPHAAHMVLHSGMPITLLPWDITKDTILLKKNVDALHQTDSPIGRFIADATRFYMEFHQSYFGFSGCSINDPAALALSFLPDLAQTKPFYIDIELHDESRLGQTIGDLYSRDGHNPNVQLVTAFDQERFLQLFLSRIERLIQCRELQERVAGDVETTPP